MNLIRELTQRINELQARLNSLFSTSKNEPEVDLIKKQLSLAFNERGLHYYKRVQFNDAVNDFTSAIINDECLAAAFYNRATIHYRMGCFQDAVDDMKKAVNLDANNIEFKLGLSESEKQLNATLKQLQ